MWKQPVGDYPFWHVAYYVLFYCDFYLLHGSRSFRPQSFHRTDDHHFGFNADGQPCVAGQSCDKATLQQYVEHCRTKIAEIVSAETEESLAGPSGCPWSSIPRAELFLVNICHVHHHAVQLSIQLNKLAGIQVDWVGSGWKEL